MAKDEKIVNKIIPKETILEVAKYLEDIKRFYNEKGEIDKEKNKNLSLSEKVYDYDITTCKVEYTIRFKNGKDITEKEFLWLEKNLINTQNIKNVEIYFSLYYSTNNNVERSNEYKNIYVTIYFKEESAKIYIDGKNLEEKVNKVYSDLKAIIENNDERYNKTIKNRDSRIQSFCFSIGFILSYIIYVVLLIYKTSLPEIFINMMNNKIILILGQWVVAGIVGNLFGYPIMMSIYKNLLPKRKFSHYNSSSRKRVYVDDIQDYTANNEVQIGIHAENGKKRELIEKIYKISIKIILIQLLLSVIFYFVL